jgi:hypothetical protein
VWRAEAPDVLHEAVAALLWETGASAVPHHWHTEALQAKTQSQRNNPYTRFLATPRLQTADVSLG